MGSSESEVPPRQNDRVPPAPVPTSLTTPLSSTFPFPIPHALRYVTHYVTHLRTRLFVPHHLAFLNCISWLMYRLRRRGIKRAARRWASHLASKTRTWGLL